MNRPNKQDYEWDFEEYFKSLEKYCDELEKYCDHQDETIRILSIAYHKACFMLDQSTTCPLDKLDCDIGCEHKCNDNLSMDYTECWKEYFIKEIKNE